MRTDSTLAVIFFTRKKRNNPDKLDIYIRITVNQRRAEISLKRDIPVCNWDVLIGRAKGNTPNIERLNGYLEQVYAEIFNSYKQLHLERKLITANAIKLRYLGEDEQHKTLMELVAYHNSTMHITLKPGTLKNYATTEKYLKQFLKDKKKANDIFLIQLNYRFIVDFEQYIRTYRPKKAQRTCTNNGTMKHLERLMKMTNLAVKMEWLDKDPFRNYKLNFVKSERNYLSQREIDLITNTTFKSETYERVKDVFLFSCYSGLSYIDVKELVPTQLLIGIDGNYWLHTKREKTNEAVKIPLLPKAKEIVEKYKQESEISEKLLPVLSMDRAAKVYRPQRMKVSSVNEVLKIDSFVC